MARRPETSAAAPKRPGRPKRPPPQLDLLPLEAAQNLMWDAFDSDDPAKRVALAREALALSPLCADAWSMLARDDAKSSAEAIDLYRRAVAAGQEALGDDFEELAGMFWGFIETRPYMRARHELGLILGRTGAWAEAAETYAGMLELNPNDNQGARYLLMDALLTLGRDKEARVLLKRYDGDGAAHWLWSAALLRFRAGGAAAAAGKALKQAAEMNPHLAPMLTGARRPPKEEGFVGWGDESEAAEYVRHSSEPWKRTEGALAWVAKALGEGPVPVNARGGAGG